MLPFNKQNDRSNQPAARFQSDPNDPRAISTNLLNTNFDMDSHPQQRRVNNRSVACRFNPISSSVAVRNFNDSIQFSPGTQLNQPIVNPVYQIQPNSGFLPQWHNQQMTYGVMAAIPVGPMGNAADLKQNSSVQLMGPVNEFSVMEKQDYQSTSVQKTASMTQRGNFQFASSSSSSSAEKKISKVIENKLEETENCLHLVGLVEQVLRWYQIAKTINMVVLFEVHGNLESVKKKSNNISIMMIKQGTLGPSIQGVFCSIDRPFMNYLSPGDSIVCVGVMKGARKMQVFNAWHETGKPEDYSRVSFLCQRALQEKVMAASEM